MRSFGPSEAKNSFIRVGVCMPALTVEILRSNLLRLGRPLASFHAGSINRCGQYSYRLEVEPGTQFGPGFAPELTPGEMLMLGVFEGRYLNDCVREFPAEWFLGALMTGTLSPEKADISKNLFGVGSRQPLSVWRENGWAPSEGRRGRTDDHYGGALGDPAKNPDDRGWFQWYCRYWLGRRIPDLDRIQIARWRSFVRHRGGLHAGCPSWSQDPTCRLRERQALLQWAYNPFL
jgi:hypothetical protein